MNSPLGFVSQSWRMEVTLGHQHQCPGIRIRAVISLIILLLPFTVKCRSVCADAPHRMEVKHGRLKLSQLNGGNAESPDVAQVVVATLLFHCHYLWSHPGKSKVARMSGVQDDVYLRQSTVKQQVANVTPLTSRGSRWMTFFWLPRHWSPQPPQNRLDGQCTCNDESNWTWRFQNVCVCIHWPNFTSPRCVKRMFAPYTQRQFFFFCSGWYLSRIRVLKIISLFFF